MPLASLSRLTRFGTVLSAIVVGLVLLLNAAPATAASHQTLPVERRMSKPASTLVIRCAPRTDSAQTGQRIAINHHWLIPICSADGVSAIAPPPMAPLEDAHINQGDDIDAPWMSASLPQGPDHSPDYSSDAKYGLTVDGMPALSATFALLRWIALPTGQAALGFAHMVYRPPRS